jgi:hypothetical protein
MKFIRVDRGGPYGKTPMARWVVDYSTCYAFLRMADEHANTDTAISERVRILKSKIPPADHAALDSRVQGLINDPSTNDDDVISILRSEFDPTQAR